MDKKRRRKRVHVEKDLQVALVENMVKKNCSRFSVVVLLTTLVFTHQTVTILFYFILRLQN